MLALTYSLRGRHENAVAEIQRIKGWENDPQSLAWRGYVYGAAGNNLEAEKALSRLGELSAQTYVSPLCVAPIHVAMRNNDAAFESFEKVFQERSVGGALVLKANPLFDPLRADPRFPELLRRANLGP